MVENGWWREKHDFVAVYTTCITRIASVREEFSGWVGNRSRYGEPSSRGRGWGRGDVGRPQPRHCRPAVPSLCFDSRVKRLGTLLSSPLRELPRSRSLYSTPPLSLSRTPRAPRYRGYADNHAPGTAQSRRARHAVHIVTYVRSSLSSWFPISRRSRFYILYIHTYVYIYIYIHALFIYINIYISI